MYFLSRLDRNYDVESYNLGQNEWNIWTTPPPISMMIKWHVFAPLRLHHCFGGKGTNCSFLFCPRFNLGQNEWNIWTTPPPISMVIKWHVFAPLRLHHCFGGKEANCSFLFCPRLSLVTTICRIYLNTEMK